MIDLIAISSFLLCFFTKIQSKIRINGLISYSSLCAEFARGVCSQCCYILLQLRYLPISFVIIKGIQIGDHEIEIVNFVNNITIFLRDVTCCNRMQLILKLYEDASILKIKFSKTKLYELEHIKIELINKDKWNGHDFS